MKQTTESLKYVLIIFLWVGAYSLGLELVNYYKTKKIECSAEPLNRKNSVESSEIKFAKYVHKGITGLTKEDINGKN